MTRSAQLPSCFQQEGALTGMKFAARNSYRVRRVAMPPCPPAVRR